MVRAVTRNAAAGAAAALVAVCANSLPFPRTGVPSLPRRFHAVLRPRGGGSYRGQFHDADPATQGRAGADIAEGGNGLPAFRHVGREIDVVKQDQARRAHVRLQDLVLAENEIARVDGIDIADVDRRGLDDRGRVLLEGPACQGEARRDGLQVLFGEIRPHGVRLEGEQFPALPGFQPGQPVHAAHAKRRPEFHDGARRARCSEPSVDPAGLRRGADVVGSAGASGSLFRIAGNAVVPLPERLRPLLLGETGALLDGVLQGGARRLQMERHVAGEPNYRRIG